MKTLVALDVDGVLLAFSKSKKLDGQGEIYDRKGDRFLPIRWRKTLVERLKVMLDRPEVTVAALTTWSEAPEEFDELKAMLNIEGLMTLEAEQPTIEAGWGRVPNPRLPQKVETHRETSPLWWKYPAFELLIRDGGFERAAWLDDNLGKIPSWRARDTFPLLLLRTDETAGMLPEDLDKLERWLNAKESDYPHE